MNELREMLMEQLQLLHEHSKNGCCMPGELVDLSNAMAHIAEVLVQLDEDVDGGAGGVLEGIAHGVAHDGRLVGLAGGVAYLVIGLHV